MQEPKLPHNEQERINALYKLNILDTPIESSFERVTRLCKKIFDVSIVAISLVDKDRQWFKSIQGLDVKETPRSVSFCGHAILKPEMMIIEDALKDKRFCDNPLVTGGPKIRFYAGCPITTATNQRIGTLCIIDPLPRKLKEGELAYLADLASLVEEEMNSYILRYENGLLIEEVSRLEKKSAVDNLTQLWNRYGAYKIYKSFKERACRFNRSFGLILLDIDNFKYINDNYGHSNGDEIIKLLGKTLVNSVRKLDSVCRWGGDEFIILLDTDCKEKAEEIINRIMHNIKSNQTTSDSLDINYTISAGAAFCDLENLSRLEDLVAKADSLLYKSKAKGKNTFYLD